MTVKHQIRGAVAAPFIPTNAGSTRAAEGGELEAQRALFNYDPSVPFGVVENGAERREGALIRDVTFSALTETGVTADIVPPSGPGSLCRGPVGPSAGRARDHEPDAVPGRGGEPRFQGRSVRPRGCQVVDRGQSRLVRQARARGWREIARAYRGMEARGEVRGGRAEDLSATRPDPRAARLAARPQEIGFYESVAPVKISGSMARPLLGRCPSRGRASIRTRCSPSLGRCMLSCPSMLRRLPLWHTESRAPADLPGSPPAVLTRRRSSSLQPALAVYAAAGKGW